MNLFDTVAGTAKAALVELNNNEVQADLTGKVWMDLTGEALWFQVEDGTRTTFWVSLDFPELAAPGETLVVASDENEIRNFGE